MLQRTLLLVVVLTSLTASGCFLFRQDFPDEGCVDNRDCFQGQGEVCNLETKTCEIPADAAPVPDAPPLPDADTTDADTTDADTTDADTTDASPPDAA